MIEYRSAHPQDILEMTPQTSQRAEVDYMKQRPFEAEALIRSSLCLSGFVDDLPVAVAGFAPTGVQSHRAWAFFAPGAGPHMLGITRKALAMMGSLRSRRIDMVVEEGFIQGEKFARLLRMSKETDRPLRYSGVLGEHQNIYALVREHVRT